jgi:Flp pilus assembly pilin Flp
MMTSLVRYLTRAWSFARPGQGLVEYGLIIVLVAIGVIALLGLMGGQLNSLFSQITSSLAG